MDEILHGLNVAQKAAVASKAAVLQVLAPPGSGKTKTLTARVAYLIARQGLQPCNIIVCTFTVKAANEMKERVKGFIGGDHSKQLKLGTFHSVALRYLKSYGQHIGLRKDFGIADTSDSKAILKRLIKKLDMLMDPGTALGRISARKVKSDSRPAKPVNVEQRQFSELYAEYEATLAASNLLDYDDILLRCSFLLKSHPQCVANVQAVLIDEFQDTNHIQYELMSLFAQKRNVITIVGDPDQSIYGFRSAEIENLARMKLHWPDTLTINLEENYRSSGAILHAAQTIIEQDKERPPKRLQATHSFGLRPVIRKLPHAYNEADWMVSEIKRTQCLSGGMLNSSDYAVLLRSAALSRVIETALVRAGIPYRMVGGQRFYDRVEVKLLVDYLRVVHQPNNSEVVERIVNVPPRRIGDMTIKKLREEAQGRAISLWSLILDISQGRYASTTKLNEPARKGVESFVNVVLCGRKSVEAWNNETPSLTGLIELVSKKIDLEFYLKAKFADDESFEARWSNVKELTAQAADVAQPGKAKDLIETNGLPVLEDIAQREEVEDVLSLFLANIALTASAEKQTEAGDVAVQQVTISTIHAAKGLEWPVVFIPACYDGSIPHSRADDMDEERRLLYVGMTRAQGLLYLSCPIKDTQKQETTMSRFLAGQGIGNFFEECGPSLPMTAITSLSHTLKRSPPIASKRAELCSSLDRDEDDCWPLTGEEPVHHYAPWSLNASNANPQGFVPAWSIASAGFLPAKSALSMQADLVSTGNFVGPRFSLAAQSKPTQPGFVSVSDRYEELMETAQLRKIDKRTECEEKKAQQKGESVKTRKRQIEGQGSIATFFGKKPKTGHSQIIEPSLPSKPTVKPLRDISTNVYHQSGVMNAHQNAPPHKPKSTPLLTKPTATMLPEEAEGKDNKYVFLSSSPLPPDREEEDNQDSKQICLSNSPPLKSMPTPPLVVDNSAQQQQGDRGLAVGGFRPASTLHTTSMHQISAPQRRTLGMRRSLQGWSARQR